MPSFKVVFMYLQDLNLCFHCFSLLQKKHQTVTPMGASLNAQWLTMGLAATVDMVTRLLQMERRVKVGGAPANLFWLSQPKPKYNATALIFPRRKVFYIFFLSFAWQTSMSAACTERAVRRAPTLMEATPAAVWRDTCCSQTIAPAKPKMVSKHIPLPKIGGKWLQ